MSARAFAGRPGRASRRPAAGTCRIGPARVPGPEPCLARARALGEVARGFPPAAAEATQPVTHSYSLTRSGRPPVGALQRNPAPTAMAFLISRTWPRSSGGALGTRARTAGRGQNRFIERSEATLTCPSAQVGEEGLSRSGAQAGTTRQTGHDLALHTVRAFLAPAPQAPSRPLPGESGTGSGPGSGRGGPPPPAGGPDDSMAAAELKTPSRSPMTGKAIRMSP